MKISLVSSLTPEDEVRLARTFIDAIAGLLDVLPIAYSIHIRTSIGEELDRTNVCDRDRGEDTVRVPEPRQPHCESPGRETPG